MQGNISQPRMHHCSEKHVQHNKQTLCLPWCFGKYGVTSDSVNSDSDSDSVTSESVKRQTLGYLLVGWSITNTHNPNHTYISQDMQPTLPVETVKIDSVVY